MTGAPGPVVEFLAQHIDMAQSIDACVRLCGEAEWYRWALDGTTPSTSEVLADLVFIE